MLHAHRLILAWGGTPVFLELGDIHLPSDSKKQALVDLSVTRTHDTHQVAFKPQAGPLSWLYFIMCSKVHSPIMASVSFRSEECTLNNQMRLWLDDFIRDRVETAWSRTKFTLVATSPIAPEISGDSEHFEFSIRLSQPNTGLVQLTSLPNLQIHWTELLPKGPYRTRIHEAFQEYYRLRKQLKKRPRLVEVT